ncbi:MAG: hypothetical protein K2W96_13870 [Gemmataceae bacterium]|nr:hypothetical protein [Gemmataceae bacterium]
MSASTDDLVSPADLLFIAMGGYSVAGHRVSLQAPIQVGPCSVSGGVFHDRDGDGRWSEGDEGVPGIEVVLLGRTVRGQEVREAARTDPLGEYRFDNLHPGSYSVSCPGRWGVAGTVNGVPMGEGREGSVARVSLPPGGLAEAHSFAEARPASVSGLVLLEDEDADGPAREPLADALVLLSGVDGRGRPVQLSTRTDARGAYRFAGLHPGCYDLHPAPPRGCEVHEASAGDTGGRAVGGKAVLSLRSGMIASGCCFALRGTGSILGRAVDGARVALAGTDEAGRTVALSAIAASGRFRFDRLRPGTYRAGGGDPVALGPGAVAAV